MTQEAGAGGAAARGDDEAGRGRNRREAILAAAAGLAGARGYAAASMRDIARAAGMLPGSLYYHFPSKEELFAEVHARAVARFREAAAEAAAAESDPWARLRAAARAHLSQLLELGDRVALVSPEATSAAGAEDARMTAARDAYEREIAALVEALDLPDDVDPALFRLMLLGAMNWAPVWYRDGGRSPEEIADAFVDMLRRGLAVG